jgi:GDPmannose 4,6-dehydratase
VKALITGVTGQDGSYLAELLTAKLYDVYGIARRSSGDNTSRLTNVKNLDNFHLLSGDILDPHSINDIIYKVQPDEIYNLAAQSYVSASFEQPMFTGMTNGLGILNILGAVRDICPTARFYQASTSELYGKVQEDPQRETTPFYPRSPYGIAKLYAHWMTINYREAYGLHASCGILFNHESPRRGLEFVTRKITNAVARIKLGLQDKLYLGNLDIERDWGYAGDYVRAMWMMLQQDNPDDYVISTGEKHTIREFCSIAFDCVNLNYKDYVIIDPNLWRPAEVNTLCGDCTKAKRVLGWKPTVSFDELVIMMVNADLERLGVNQ